MKREQKQSHPPIQQNNQDTEFATELDMDSVKNPARNAIQEMYSQVGLPGDPNEQ